MVEEHFIRCEKMMSVLSRKLKEVGVSHELVKGSNIIKVPLRENFLAGVFARRGLKGGDSVVHAVDDIVYEFKKDLPHRGEFFVGVVPSDFRLERGAKRAREVRLIPYRLEK